MMQAEVFDLKKGKKKRCLPCDACVRSGMFLFSGERISTAEGRVVTPVGSSHRLGPDLRRPVHTRHHEDFPRQGPVALADPASLRSCKRLSVMPHREELTFQFDTRVSRKHDTFVFPPVGFLAAGRQRRRQKEQEDDESAQHCLLDRQRRRLQPSSSRSSPQTPQLGFLVVLQRLYIAE